jgi:hypothetical protein
MDQLCGECSLPDFFARIITHGIKQIQNDIRHGHVTSRHVIGEEIGDLARARAISCSIITEEVLGSLPSCLADDDGYTVLIYRVCDVVPLPVDW